MTENSEKRKILNVIMEPFTEMLGDEATEKTLRYIGDHYNIDRDQIPVRIDEFNPGL
jgi:hypothetical protein